MNKKILIVDDEKDITLALRELFISKGHEVLVAFTGEEAMKHLKGGDWFDLILLDIQMPGINGIEVLKEVKRKYEGIKTVILSGFLEEYKDEIESIGCDAFLSKPFSIKTLINVVDSTLSEKEVRKEVFSTLIENDKILGKAKLLFIEPNAIMYSSKLGYFRERRLCKGEYQLASAFTEEEVIEKLNDFKPDIILSEIALFRLYRVSSNVEASKNPPKDIILYGISGSKDLEKKKGVSFIGGLFDPITATVTPHEMDKLGKIVRRTAIAHNLYIEK